MQLSIYQVDAFTDRLFAGNPAAVVPLDEWLPDETLRLIARENNLSETAYFVGDNGNYHLRWFTPTNEVDLCGHATLAAAFVIFTHLSLGTDEIRFASASGDLRVTRTGERFWLDFPSRPARQWDDEGKVARALGAEPMQVLRTQLDRPDSDKIMAVFESAREVAELQPDMQLLIQLEGQGVIATAPGMNGTDFVSRYFLPKVGVPEDPVTGSTHCTLVPYWADRFEKATLRAAQLSIRGGNLECVLDGDHVRIGGHAVQYLEGQISVRDNQSG